MLSTLGIWMWSCSGLKQWQTDCQGSPAPGPGVCPMLMNSPENKACELQLASGEHTWTTAGLFFVQILMNWPNLDRVFTEITQNPSQRYFFLSSSVSLFQLKIKKHHSFLKKNSRVLGGCCGLLFCLKPGHVHIKEKRMLPEMWNCFGWKL